MAREIVNDFQRYCMDNATDTVIVADDDDMLVTLWFTKEACESQCQTIHPRLGMRESPTEVVLATDYDAFLRRLEAASELAEGLRWALQYGTFEASEDNPLHGRAHLKAINAMKAYDQTKEGG